MCELTDEQFHVLQHAIGIEYYSKDKLPKRYEAYRNRYYTGKNKNEIWDSLIELGYADAVNDGGWWYFVTTKGIKYLEKKLGIKIIELK